MKSLCGKEVREIFLKFFEEKKHLRIENSSLIPSNDPTLLFINSGMAPLKQYFTGEAIPPAKDLCNVQPCIRTIDMDDIGDRHHLTSFEMLGSWSIDNYFKEQAILLAYDLLVNKIGFPKDKLYATVYAGNKELGLSPDEESAKFWEKAGFAKDHIIYQPHADNFWGPAGETGPCGPCTEVFYDTGDQFGPAYKDGEEFDTSGRYIEIWNAGVFMEFNKDKQGNYTPLKFKSVDTGCGLERLTMIINGLDCVYDTDLLKPILDKVKQLHNFSTKTAYIITDHLRTSSFIMSEGLSPSNEGRGYVLRKLIRKCIALAAKEKCENPDFASIIETIIEHMGDFYTNFKENKANILKIFKKEQDDFSKVIKNGFGRLEKMAEGTNFQISGKDAFDLVSTYGIPLEIINQYVSEKGGSVDNKSFEEEFEKHKERSKNTGSNIDGDTSNINLTDKIYTDFEPTVFNGYNRIETHATVKGIISNNEKQTQTDSDQTISIITDQTCFYGESGGQIGDSGTMQNDNVQIIISDTKKTDNGVFIHIGKIKQGSLKTNDILTLRIDTKRHNQITANHSATHLLQAALRNVVGNDIKQAGSLVEDEKLRFDFQYDEKITATELIEIEQLVNSYIFENASLSTEEKSYQDALKEGALAFFENKYADTVRIVSIDNISKELCGGSHVNNTSEIGLFKILSEGSVGRGLRRITAITGIKAFSHMQEKENIVTNLCSMLKTNPESLTEAIDKLIQKSKEKKTENKIAPLTKEQISQKTQTINNIPVITETFAFFSPAVRDEAARISEINQGIVCFTCEDEDKVRLIVAVHKELSKKINANKIMQAVAPVVNGKGGGKPHLALGGGTDTKGISKIADTLKSFLESV